MGGARNNLTSSTEQGKNEGRLVRSKYFNKAMVKDNLKYFCKELREKSD